MNLLDARSLLLKGTLALARAERAGIRVDLDVATENHNKLTGSIDQLNTKFKSTSFFKHWDHSSGGKVNIDSNEQLAHFLYKTKKLTPAKATATGKGSTDEEALKGL